MFFGDSWYFWISKYLCRFNVSHNHHSSYFLQSIQPNLPRTQKNWLLKLVFKITVTMRRRTLWSQRARKHKSRWQTLPYPWHGEGHAEVLSTLQSEAPRRWADEGYGVYVHRLQEDKEGNAFKIQTSHFPSPFCCLLLVGNCLTQTCVRCLCGLNLE